MASRRFHRLVSSAANTNATVVWAAPVTVHHIVGYNAKASAVFLKLYQLASNFAVPDENATPLMTIYLPSASAFALDFSDGLQIPVGLGYRLTTGSADNDTGAVASGDILGLNITAW